MGTPKIYLDMDGVLADFFSEYAKMAGVKSGQYREIPKDKVEATLDAMVGTDFFARLPVFPSVPALLKLVLSYTDHYNICSSPLRGDFANSEKYKRVWIKDHLNPQPQDIIITANKSKYAKQADGTPNVLIDDRGINISGWIGAGGIGVKYQADEDSLSIVKQALDKAFKKEDTEESWIIDYEKGLDEVIKKYADEGSLLANPKNTYVVRTDSPYDYIRLGTHLGNPADVDPDDFNPSVGSPDVPLVFYGGEKEKEMAYKYLKRLGYKIQPGDGYTDMHYDAQQDENFADGKNPGRKGLAKRSGVDCKQPVSKLRKIAKNSSGEKQRMAHWCANMKSGRNK
jgi:5'(3')-deoxyribonucleotidase